MPRPSVAPVYEPAARADPVRGANCAAQPILKVKSASGLDGVLYRRGREFAIFGLKKRKEKRVIYLLFDSLTKKRPCPVRPSQLLGKQVQIPSSDASLFDREPQTLIANPCVERGLIYAHIVLVLSPAAKLTWGSALGKSDNRR
jgi:hypothetical protein